MAASILVVEDDPALARSLTRNLVARGYAARTATTAAAATAALRDHLPSLMLLDIDLPDGSGWEVLRELRAAGQGDVAVIVISALRPNARLAGELGCAGILEKPFPVESLLRLVARYGKTAERLEPIDARSEEPEDA